jgi:YrbI family 3-deoxy-D-manno-octulosonate 8-phosphate phosphatase
MFAHLLQFARRQHDAHALDQGEQQRRDALIPRLKDIRFLIFDFDGVFTNNLVIVSEEGKESVLCNRSDGLGIGMLRAHVDMAVLTAELNPAPLRRCEKLRLECVQVEKHKLPALQQMLAKRSLEPAQAAFVGNDVNDIPCMQHVGVGIAVADAWPQVKAAAHAVTTRAGGRGAVREVIEWFLQARGTSALAQVQTPRPDAR